MIYIYIYIDHYIYIYTHTYIHTYYTLIVGFSVLGCFVHRLSVGNTLILCIVFLLGVVLPIV